MSNYNNARNGNGNDQNRRTNCASMVHTIGRKTLEKLGENENVRVLMIDGFVKDITFSEYTDNGTGEKRPVAFITLSSTFDPKRIAYMFGPDAVNPEEGRASYVTIRLALYDKAVEVLGQYPYCENQRVSALIANPTVDVRTTDDGKTYRTVRATCQGLPVRRSSSKDRDGNQRPSAVDAFKRNRDARGQNNGGHGASYGGQQPASAPASAPAPAPVSNGFDSHGFVDLGFDPDDDELPF